MKIATGILNWNGAERRSDRYGEIACFRSNYDEDAFCDPDFNAEPLEGKKVKLWAVVTANRISGHIGDLALGILPSKPEVGEVIQLGVGVLGIGKVAWEDTKTIILIPKDGRSKFWMDPRQLYRLHDQTVELFAEETDEDFSPAPEIEPSQETCLGTGDSDNSYQVKGRLPNKIAPDIKRLGDGMFMLSGPTNDKGKKVDAIYDDE